MSGTRLQVGTAGSNPAWWLGRVLAFALIAFFVVFFVIPLGWLLVAPTKSTTQLYGLNGEQPFSFGSFEQLTENWNNLVAFQDSIIWTWLGNSVFYSGVALAITILVTIPAGYALAMTDFTFRRTLLVATLVAYYPAWHGGVLWTTMLTSRAPNCNRRRVCGAFGSTLVPRSNTIR